MTDSSTQTPVRSADDQEQDDLKERGPIPKHIAIIMDGNGRWAKQQGKLRVQGHKEGVESVRDIAEACAQIGVEALTLYTFSTENWYRPITEVNALMQLLVRTVRREVATLKNNKIKLRAIGDLSQLPKDARNELDIAITETDFDSRMILNLALSYSGRWDISQAAKEVAQKVKSGELEVADVNEETLSRELSTAGLPDPDLLIRTGGEYRISNFLLWQTAYTEIVITDLFWPAFRRAQLYGAIKDFQDRDRRYGRVREDKG